MEAHQAPLSLGFSRQEHWSGLPFPSPMREREKWNWSHSVVSDSYRPHGLQTTRLRLPWDFPGKSTGVGCLAFSVRDYLGALKSQFLSWSCVTKQYSPVDFFLNHWKIMKSIISSHKTQKHAMGLDSTWGPQFANPYRRFCQSRGFPFDNV